MNEEVMPDNNIAERYGFSAPAVTSSGMLEVQTVAVAQMQAQIYLAKKFPRNEIEAGNKIALACQRPLLAEKATYAYARGGAVISGASIRLAEAIAQNWGNIKISWKEIGRTKHDGIPASEIIASAWDMETGAYSERQVIVKHWRDTKKGGYLLTDERDIREVCGNIASRVLRGCILQLIPSDIVEMALEQCEATLKTKVKITPELLKSLLDKFAEFFVTKKQIEARIQRSYDAITPAQVVELGKVYTALKDGVAYVSDYFDVDDAPETATHKENKEKMAAKMQAMKEKPVSAKDAPTAKAEVAPAERAPDVDAPFDAETGEIVDVLDDASYVMPDIQFYKPDTDYSKQVIAVVEGAGKEFLKLIAMHPEDAMWHEQVWNRLNMTGAMKALEAKGSKTLMQTISNQSLFYAA